MGAYNAGVGRENGARYDEGKLYLRKGADKTNSHELAHRMEEVVPGLRSLVREYLESRTTGETPVPLGKGYRPSEMTTKDAFWSEYCGKVYPVHTEIISMGVRGIFFESEKVWKDEDYVHFILGVLAGK